MVIWRPKSENTQDYYGKTSTIEVKLQRSGLTRLGMFAMNIFVRWKNGGKSSGTATITGKQTNSRRHYIRYGTIRTTRRLPRFKGEIRTRGARSRKQECPAQTWRTVPSLKIKAMDVQHQRTRSPTMDLNRLYRLRIARQVSPLQDPNQGRSKILCEYYIYPHFLMANIFSVCSENVFNHPNAARFPVHQVRPVTQNNIGPATPTQESTNSASVPLQNAAQIASGECTPTEPQNPPRAPEQIAVPQDGLPAATTLLPAPENAGPMASTNSLPKLLEKRYARTEKMRPGLGCTIRYVCQQPIPTVRFR